MVSTQIRICQKKAVKQKKEVKKKTTVWIFQAKNRQNFT